MVEAKKRPNWLNIISFILLTGFGLKAIVAITSMAYDWDIDHELYFGQQLTQGTLMYTSEYHDKLPFGTTFLALPSILNGFQAWAIQSFLLLLIGSWCIFSIMQRLIADEHLNLRSRRTKEVALFTASAYVFLIAFLPGNISHINQLSTNLALFSFVFLFSSKTTQPREKTSRRQAICYVAATICAAMAISIRPYYAAPLISSIIWVVAHQSAVERVRSSSTKHQVQYKQVKQLSKEILVWLACVSLAGLVINSLPYFLTGQLNHFIDGIAHNGQKLNPEPVSSIIESQLTKTSPLFVLGTLSLIYPFIRLSRRLLLINNKKLPYPGHRRVQDVDLILGVLVPFILLELAILSRHYWPHYQQLFAPYITISIGLIVAHLFQGKGKYMLKFKELRLPKYVKAACISSIAFALISTFTVRIAGQNKIPGEVFLESVGAVHEDHYLLKEVMKLVGERKSKNLPNDFLFTDSMFIHWKLREPRHGFPHAANLGQIKEGWWDNRTERERAIDYPYNQIEVCEKLIRSGPSLIYTPEDSFIGACLKSNSYPYHKIKALSSNIIVFERET